MCSFRPLLTLLCILLTLALVTEAHAQVGRVTNGLVAFYPMDEGSGTTITDQSGVGTSMNLTLSGTAN